VPPLLMAGFAPQHIPTRTLRAAAKGSADPLAKKVSTGQIRAWDLFSLRASALPGAQAWADKTLDAIVAAAVNRYSAALDCEDCTDLGFYGLTDRENPDILTALLRREGDGGYEQLRASGEWAPYETSYDQHVEILSRELAGDLAEAITAGASGLARRYFWPKAFLPPDTMIAAAPAPEMNAVEAKPTAGPEDGWTEYAIVDDLDPGAVLELIRLRPGPELVAYRNGIWGEAPDLLSDLQGVQPPPLVELDQSQLDAVIEQIGGPDEAVSRAEGTSDAVPAPEAAPEASAPAEATTAAGLPKSQKCEYGDHAATQRILHSEGMAYIPVCDEHLDKGTDAAVHCTPDGSEDPSNIVRVEAIAAAAKGALIADAPLTVSPDPRAEKLRRYWTTGKGALKIRWGTPGDWTRCYRQLRKHMGVRAKGYCQNLHKRSTGKWAGDRSNRGRTAALAASGRRAQPLSLEAALVASVSTGAWVGPGGGEAMLKDGVYAEAGENATLLRTLTAGGFPVAPPDEWFNDPQLEGPTPLTVDDDGHIFGHIATFDIAHIGLPGRVHAPKSRSGYAYFKTGELVTASGAKVPVGQLTLAGGHAPLQADAAAAVAHYDNTASAVADVNCGEDRYGIWVAGALRPEVTPPQLRTLRASAPSGDWRPINGNLEMVAVCQVNVPGFPTTRARVASGAITALVAAGARPLAARKLALLADAEMAERLSALETFVYGNGDAAVDLVEGDDAVVADGEVIEPSVTAETPAAPETPAEAPATPVDDKIERARQRARELREQRAAATVQTDQQGTDPDRDARIQALRDRVHNRQPVMAASADGQGNSPAA